MKAEQQAVRPLPSQRGNFGADRSSKEEELASALSPGISVLNYIIENIRATGKDPKRTLLGFFLGWVAFFVIWRVIPAPPDLSANGMTVLAIVVWACIMWVSEALPVGITGIGIPTLLIVTHALPWKDGKPPLVQVFGGFTTEVLWLCLFAFFVGAVMQLLKLDRRIALGLLDKLKASNVGQVIWGMFPVNVALGFLIPAANARAATLLPVINGINELLGDTARELDAKKAITIQGLVYAPMICGVFILTAHLPNMIMVGIFENHDFKNLGYLQWMILHLPYLGMFPLTQLWIKYYFRTSGVEISGGHAEIHKKHKELGPMSPGEWVLLALFGGVAVLFMLGKGSPILQVHGQQLGVIGLLATLVLFAPGLFPFKWKAVQDRTIWGTFLLLGGAITMTSAMTQSGLAKWLADIVHNQVVGLPWWGVVLALMVGTQIMRLGMLSNVAAVAMLAPVVFAMAGKLELHPVAFTLLVCNTDTFAYVLPTQITAAVIAYGTETFSTMDYAKVGSVSILLAILYGLVVIAPWYALWGIPVWNAAAPWPF
ncbi:MAG: anion permease [Desulfomonile tiedjei]|uniref:Anion permease n=1 Tax=Desulfomonile tiedjei TaxID=2358 RepID=A0A9D6Z2V3_9BACT|nr:anion permease [Desulfomonile tiedjei]